MPAIIRVVDGRTIIKMGENSALAIKYGTLAEQFANEAELSAETAALAAAAVGVYTTVGDGEAATTNGQSFYVASGGEVTLYINNAGTGDEVASLITPVELASTAPGEGADLVGVLQSGTGAVGRTLKSRLRDTVSIFDFDVKGDGVYDDAPGIRAAIAAHPGKEIIFPKPTAYYKLGSSIGVLPDGTRLVGASKKYVVLKRAYSAADYLITMNANTGLQDICFDGNGLVHTGGGALVPKGHGRQSGRNIRLINFAGMSALHFACDAALAGGSQSSWDVMEAWRVDSTANSLRWAITHDDPGAPTPGHLISMSSLQFSGYESIDFGACNNWLVSNSSLFPFATSPYGIGVAITNSRISQGSGGAQPIYLDGNGSLTGCHIFPFVEISNLSGSAWSIVGGYMNSGYLDNNPNSTTYVVDRSRVAYTPKFYGGGVEVTVGDGSIVASWQRDGTEIRMWARLTVGSTTVIPSGAITVDLPDKSDTGLPPQLDVIAHIAAGGGMYKAGGRIAGGELVARLERDTTGPITNISPATLSAGSLIIVECRYRR